MKKGKLLNIALSIAFINILFVCFSIINVNAEEDTDTLNTNDESTVMESGWTNKENNGIIMIMVKRKQDGYIRIIGTI